MDYTDNKDLGASIRKSNLTLGKQKVNYTSEASGRFGVPKDCENVTLDETTKKDLRKHHFSLGYLDFDNKTEYSTLFTDK